MTDNQKYIRWFMQLPSHYQISIQFIFGFACRPDVPAYERDKLFFKYLKNNDDVILFIQMAKNLSEKELSHGVIKAYKEEIESIINRNHKLNHILQ